MNAAYFIRQLGLQPHPEGGYYKETYRATGTIGADALPARFGGDRHFSTAIYYLLQNGDFSAFHRIKSDECWHFYAGDPLLIHVIEPDGTYTCAKIGKEIASGETFQWVVPATAWFAAELSPGGSFALAGCTVSPGFAYADFEMAVESSLAAEFPATCHAHSPSLPVKKCFGNSDIIFGEHFVMPAKWAMENR